MQNTIRTEEARCYRKVWPALETALHKLAHSRKCDAISCHFVIVSQLGREARGVLKAIPKAGVALGIFLVVALGAYLVTDYVSGSPNLDLAFGIGLVGGAIGWIFVPKS